MTEWRTLTLDEVCKRIFSGGTPSTKHPEYWDGDICWLSSGETSQRFIYDTERKITQVGVAHSSTKKAQKGSVVIATAGQGYTRGQVSFLMTDTYMNQSVIACQANVDCVLPLYLYYNLDNRYEELRQLSDGTSTRGGLSGWILKRMNIDLPPLGVQAKIVSVLEVLDRRIEENDRINNNLEQQARSIFQSWFIDYEPFGCSAPQEWKQSTLGQIATMKTDSWSPVKNLDMEVEHYSIPAFDEQHYPSFEIASGIKSNKYILSPDSVMISKLNPDTKRIWRPMCLSSHPVCSTEFIVYEAKKKIQRDYIYSIIDSVPFLHHLCSHTTGSTNSRQRATPKATLEFPILLPPDSVIEAFCGIVTPMYDMIASNIIENQSLAKTRDSLLPKLMSGEIDVSNLDI